MEIVPIATRNVRSQFKNSTGNGQIRPEKERATPQKGHSIMLQKRNRPATDLYEGRLTLRETQNVKGGAREKKKKKETKGHAGERMVGHCWGKTLMRAGAGK